MDCFELKVKSHMRTLRELGIIAKVATVCFNCDFPFYDRLQTLTCFCVNFCLLLCEVLSACNFFAVKHLRCICCMKCAIQVKSIAVGW